MSVQILQGDCREILPTLPSGSIDCCVTSPPYWGLRDYGVACQIGLEATPEQFVEQLVAAFREVRRVLKPTGTLWVNMGDGYASQGGPEPAQTKWQVDGASATQNGGRSRKVTGGLKPKDLIGQPWMLAFALRADGWYLRSEVIWHKPNPMPESVRDRPTKAHETIFLLSKSPRYFYDAEAVKTPAVGPTDKMPDGWDTGPGAHGNFHSSGREKGRATDKQRGHSRRHAGFNDRWDNLTKSEQTSMGANARSVWTIATQPYPEAHFATFPEALAKQCILAGCPAGGTVLDPFAGSGTVGQVAQDLGHSAVLIEANPDYIGMIERRCAQRSLLAEVCR